LSSFGVATVVSLHALPSALMLATVGSGSFSAQHDVAGAGVEQELSAPQLLTAGFKDSTFGEPQLVDVAHDDSLVAAG
jgi:hypothetical protein